VLVDETGLDDLEALLTGVNKLNDGIFLSFLKGD
jgi:hypothetical protein